MKILHISSCLIRLTIDDIRQKSDTLGLFSFLNNLNSLLIQMYEIEHIILPLVIILQLPVQNGENPDGSLIGGLPMIDNIHKRLQTLNEVVLAVRV